MNMKPQEKTQDDLFGQAQDADKKMRRKTRFLLPDAKNSLIISYETMIFGIIGFVMVCIITFSLGVEKGRYDEKQKRVMLSVPQTQPELKKGVSNVATPKPKNIKSR
ncbi:MAG: hypothetical protein Q8N76_06025 [Candidatus Omnitrophota bacterium]|nr:hypothetical protein [Candidatus Omnitrophota bacterium]